MFITRGIETIAHVDRAIALGNFDGIHRGHQELIRQVVLKARQMGLRSAVMVFDPHPLELLCPERAPRLLTIPEQRAEFLEAFGIDELLVVPFTPRFSELSPEQFAGDILARSLGARAVVVGYDYTFGRLGSGKATDLVRFGQHLGFETKVVEPVKIDEMVVSSSTIRTLLAQGDMVAAGRLLGRPFLLDGTVGHGEARGRSLGYPTANMAVDPRLLLPRYGVYATRQYWQGKRGIGVTNVGVKPTFEGRRPTIEVHFLDHEEDLYEQRVRVEFVGFIRPECRFGDIDSLRLQIEQDCRRSRELLLG